MAFVTDDHILVSLSSLKAPAKKRKTWWRIYNVRQGTIIYNEHNLFKDFEIACPDFSNLDDPKKRFVVLRLNKDQQEE